MAGRIPQVFVDELLDRVDIVELIDSRVKLKKSGKNYMACCPFHDEKTPSFSVNSDKQFYHCFGCGVSGNAVGFLMEYEHRGFPDAVEYLAQQQGMVVPHENEADPQQQKQRQDIYGILEKVGRYYQEQLRSHPQAAIAQDYLKGRGLTGQVAQRFGIGYAPEGWDNLLKALAIDESSRRLLMQAGMEVEKEGEKRVYDRFRHRIMFPIRDVRGRVIAFGGRVLNDDKPKYLNSPETDVFHKGRELYGLYEAMQANRHLDRILMVEGYMDVVALAQYEITFAAATLGTAASEAHLDKAFRYAPEVVFCFDGDEAGSRAARRALEVSLPTLAEGRQVRFLFLPEGTDPDSLVREQGKDAFLERLSQAMPLSEFLFSVASEGLDLSSPEGRARLITNVCPSLIRLPAGPYKLQLINLLAIRSLSDRDSIAALVNTAETHAASKARQSGADAGVEGEALPSAAYKRMQFPSKKEGFEPTLKGAPAKLGLLDEASSLLLQQPDLLEHCDLTGLQGLKEVSEAERFMHLVDLVHEYPAASLNKLLGLWQSRHGAADSSTLYQLAARESLLDAQARIAQFQDILLRLQQNQRDQQLQALIDKAKTHPLSGEEKQTLNRLLNGG